MKIETRAKKYLIPNTEYRDCVELCEAMHIKSTDGKSRMKILEQLSMIAEIERVNGSRRILLKEFYNNKPDYIPGTSFVNYPQFKIPYQDRNKTGVYIITNGDVSYIGSTKAGFRKRFNQHNVNKDGLHTKTYDLLQNGGEFRILEIIEDDESIIRQREQYYIDLYREEGKTLLNTDKFIDPIISKFITKTKSTTRKITYRSISIESTRIEEVFSYLKENEIKYKIKKSRMEKNHENGKK